MVGEAYLAHAGEGEVLHERYVEMRGAAEAVESDVDVELGGRWVGCGWGRYGIDTACV